MSYIRSHLIPIGLIFFLGISGCLLYLYSYSTGVSDRQLLAQTVSVTATGDITFEVVTTPDVQERGLGGRIDIPDNYGMLFVFSEDGMPGFWMKDMLTSIDMIWLTDAGTIASITPSVSPQTFPSVFYPPQPIRYVIETRAGFAQEKEWKIGTQVPLPLPYGK